MVESILMADVTQHFVTNTVLVNLCKLFINSSLGKYGGERSGVECDTKTPGCEHMCMNHLFPIGPPFFWTLEIIALSLPTLFFIVYISHKQNQGFAIDEDHCKDNIEVAKKGRFQKLCQKQIVELNLIDTAYENAKKDNTKKFWNVYMLYASVRLLVGLGMLAAYFHICIFTLEMPDRYICDRAPCTGLTTCYVSKLTIRC